MKKTNGPVLLFGTVGIGILIIMLWILIQRVASVLLEAAYQYTNAEMITGILMGTGAIWLIVLISVTLTLLIEGIVFVMFLNTIKRVLVAKLSDIAKEFGLEITPKYIWSILFEKKVENKDE